MVGRLIQTAAAASNMKNCTLELGGKSPNIVLEATRARLTVRNGLTNDNASDVSSHCREHCFLFQPQRTLSPMPSLISTLILTQDADLDIAVEQSHHAVFFNQVTCTRILAPTPNPNPDPNPNPRANAAPLVAAHTFRALFMMNL